MTRVATENVNSLLYLRGIDAAIINSDALDEYKSQVPEIQSLTDLVGKKVNHHTQGTAAAYSGPLIFSCLGLAVDKAFIPHQVALEQMRKGEMAAVVFITSKSAGLSRSPAARNASGDSTANGMAARFIAMRHERDCVGERDRRPDGAASRLLRDGERRTA